MVHLDQAKNLIDRKALLKGNWGFFHELGHNHQERDWTFDGTVEVTCNWFSLYVFDKLCGIPPELHKRGDMAFRMKHMKRYPITKPDFNKWKSDPFLALCMYIQLQQAEAAFRIQKSELTIRPIWHQKEERVKAHILVCFLAFALWKALEGWQKRAGLGSSPRTILEEMARINCVDVVLPLKTGKPMRLRCVVKPEDATAILVDRLGLRLPKRLEPPELPDEM